MPRLVIRKGEGEGKDHALAGPCIVGRHASANFVLGDTLVSRNHFRVVPEGGVWFVEDMGSTNGTIVNGRKAKKVPLSDGDVIIAGTTELQFVQKDPFASASARPAVAPAAVEAPPPAATATVTARPALPVAAPPAPPAATVPRPAVPVPVPAAKPAAAAPAKPPPAPPAPPAPAKPAVQAPVPTKRRR